ncbi:MAG: hypothetical protein HY901_16570, partial [Deltaproteobacteria bacterium]|nr:hypothetical protein [Deltaproteobacteria bacterium]
MRGLLAAVALVLVGPACWRESPPLENPGEADAADGGRADAGAVDAGPPDPTQRDASLADADVVDADAVDAAAPDTGPQDASHADSHSPGKIRCLETVTGDLCGLPEKILPGEPVGRPERILLSRPGPIFEVRGLALSLAGDEKLIKGQTHTMRIRARNGTANAIELRYAYELNEDTASESYRFFGLATVTNPEGATGHDRGSGTYYSLVVGAGGSAEIAIQVTPAKESFYNETKSYLVFRVMDGTGAEVGAVTLTARVEPVPGAEGTVACGASTFPSVYENDNGSGPFGAFNRGYTRSVCCDGVFYPMAECCHNQDCAAGLGCVDGFCVAKPEAAHLFKGTKSVLVGYGINDTNVCTVTDPSTTSLPGDVVDYYRRIDRFFNGMANASMGAEGEFIHFEIAR